MNIRKTVALTAASLVVVGGAGTAVAQDAASEAPSSSAPATSTAAADSGSLAGGSLESGSLESGSLEGGSAEGLMPKQDANKYCELPGLGGSVSKIYPLLGVTGVPSIVVTLVTGALDAFPNALEMLGAEGYLPQLGSLEGPLCSTLLGGKMVASTTSTPAPTATATVTVVLDADGNPTTTVSPSATSVVPTSTSKVATTTTTAKADQGSLSGLGFGS